MGEMKVAQSCLTVWDPMDRLLCPWNSPGKNTGVDSHSLLQGIFPTQELNPSLFIAGRFFTVGAAREAHGGGEDPTVSPKTARGALVLLIVTGRGGQSQGSRAIALLWLHQTSVASSSGSAPWPGSRGYGGAWPVGVRVAG